MKPGFAGALGVVGLAFALSGCTSTAPGEAVLLRVDVTSIDQQAGVIRGVMQNVGDVELAHGTCPAVLQVTSGGGWSRVPNAMPPSCPAIGLVLAPGQSFEFAVTAPAGSESCPFRLLVSTAPTSEGAFGDGRGREVLQAATEPFCLS